MRWDWSYGIWGAWLLLFLLLELPGEFRWVPWVTLSETSWKLESDWWGIRALVFGFLIGLCIHIVFRTGLGSAVLLGMVISLACHLTNKAWP